MPKFVYNSLFQFGKDDTKYDLVSKEGISERNFDDKKLLFIEPQVISQLTERAFADVSHLLRSSHLKQLSLILNDNEASENDKFVALEMIKNANISSAGVLPMCQDTGTAIVLGYKGENIFTGVDDSKLISQGIYDTYQTKNLRYSQVAPLSMFDEVNTNNNLPAQIEIYSATGNEYKFAFIQKGGGSANKSFLYQKTKSVLNPESLRSFLYEAIINIGTSACPPYHLAIVIGGMSAEFNMKTLKLASIRYLDKLPKKGDKTGRAWRDIEWERIVLEMTQKMGIGAQFGGKYFCHDVRVIRLPRHGASCPISVGVSCSADRQILGKINKDGAFIERLEKNPAKFLPNVKTSNLKNNISINLNNPMKEILNSLSKHPVKTKVSLSGKLIVARDTAHAKLLERLNSGGGLPDYFKENAVYYAGPAKTPEGYASGSFGPTTAGRMDNYVEQFQREGGSMVMLAKGNRSKQVRESCKKYGGFYLGSIGGAAAKLALDSIRKIKILEFPELGMEAVWEIEVEKFPAFIIIDDKGNDFYNI